MRSHGSQRGPGPLAPRLTALALGAACLLAGLDASLLRLGLPAPVPGAELAALHGPLMLVGFLGTVISLERAVAARASWAYLAPFSSAAGCLLLLVGAPAPLGRGLLVAAALALCATYLRIHRRAPAPAVDIQAMGALALLLGDLLWLMGAPIETAVALWLLLPTLTIIGERLELARVAFLDPVVEEAVRALCAAALLGCCLMVVEPGARLLTGPALLGLAVIMVSYDVARRTIRARGAVRFMAASMLAGYAWLAVAGLTWSLGGWQALSAGAYEIIIHALAVGYAFSMILAHAPVIIPAVVHRGLPYHPAMWLPCLLIHLGMVVRVAGLAHRMPAAWQLGGVLGAVAIILFMALTLTRVVASGGKGAPGPVQRRRAAP
ncbi:hypothetical protein [Actinomyces bowdenii]|uniref:hypothetical protein n=1 Tax=Actinomyces bowdenii TaxID=131109 RepID=UPI00163A6D74|nr:hypothetical protein [Actinomyces bowdenii]